MNNLPPSQLGRMLLCVITVGVVLAGETAAPVAVANPLPGGWTLRTGILSGPGAAKAAIDERGIISIEGGGSTNPLNAAFVYKAFTGDFILTARRISFDHGTAHENAGAGLAATGDLASGKPSASVSSGGWQRMVRRGDRIGFYEGPDGLQWIGCGRGNPISGTVYAGFYTDGNSDSTVASKAKFADVTIDEKPVFTWSTTWLGNDFEGGAARTVNSSMYGLGVAPDGTCVTVGANGEQENNLGVYRDGQVFTHSGKTNNWANPVVLLPNGLGYLASQNNTVVEIDWRKNGQQTGKVSKKISSGVARGMAVFKNELFAACRDTKVIVVLDLKTLKWKREFPFERCGPIAVDAKGVLWVVEEGWVSGHPFSYPYPKPFRILGLDSQTGQQVNEITGVELPSAIFADEHGPSKARLLVADNGADQQVKIFDVSTAKPQLVGTLGAKGGVFAGTPGEMKPGKFNGLSGVGSDAKGNIYTTTCGYPYRVVCAAGMPNVSEIKAFAPEAIGKPEPDALWSLQCTGAGGCNGAYLDAKTGDVYVAGLSRYSNDATRGLGKEWKLAGITYNMRDDSDGETIERWAFSAPNLRWIEGQRFLFLRERVYRLDQHGNLGTLVRINNFKHDKITKQKAYIDKGAKDPFSLDAMFGRFPANLPEPTLDKNKAQTDWVTWEWIDGSGGGASDGKQQREEYHDLTQVITRDPGEDWIGGGLDDNLDMWIAGLGKRDIQLRKFSGLKNGVPQWSNQTRSFPIPKPFRTVLSWHYQADRDSMVIAGQTEDNPGGYQTSGEVIRYSTWSTDPTPGPRLAMKPPGTWMVGFGESSWDNPRTLDVVSGFSVVGDVLYVPNRVGAVRAFDLVKGNLIEWITAGPETYAVTGWFDVFDTAINAFDVGKGEHLLLCQSNQTIRILSHRWKPDTCNNLRLPPAPEIRAYSHSGRIELRWGGRTGITGAIRGYQVSRSATKDGTYHKVGDLITTPSFSEPRPDGEVAWYRVATVNLVGAGPGSEPLLAVATTPAISLVTATGKLNDKGLDLDTRGNWLGVYGSEAAHLANDWAKSGETAAARYFTAGSIIWPGTDRQWGRPASASDNPDLLQSEVAPGKRCQNYVEWNGSEAKPTGGVLTITDGMPRQMTFAFAGTSRFVFKHAETGAVLFEHAVAWPAKAPKATILCAFTVSGRFRVHLYGEAFKAVFFDPVAGSK